jgi:hypothetical protein
VSRHPERPSRTLGVDTPITARRTGCGLRPRPSPKSV